MWAGVEAAGSSGLLSARRRQGDKIWIIGVPLDQSSGSRLRQDHVEFPYRNAIVARDIVGATPRVRGASHTLVQCNDKPADETWVRGSHGP